MDNKEKMTNEKDVCPCCDHHCPVDNLHCSKGKEHFGIAVDEKDRERGHGGKHRGKHENNRDERHGHGENGFGGKREHGGQGGHGGHGESGMRGFDAESADASEVTMALLLQCGHFLHHSQNTDEMDCRKMFEVLTEEEHDQLNMILKKCLESWR